MINEETDAVFTVKRSTEDSRTYTLYTGSSVDQVALPEGSNTTAEGSLILTLKASYLNTLAVGDHKVTISFKDGSVETTLKIKSAEPTPTPKPMPKTGDSAPLALWLGLILVGLIGLATFIALRRGMQKK